MTEKFKQNHKLDPNSETDLLSEFLKNDRQYQSQKKQAYLDYKLKYRDKFITSNNSLYMTIKKLFFTLTHSTAALATLFVILVGGVSTLAMENLAPEEYKPSTIIEKVFNPEDFESNTQTDKNPYIALTPDNQNDVAILKECDMAIKYPKTFEDFNMTAKKQSNSYFFLDVDQSKDSSWNYYAIPYLECNSESILEAESSDYDSIQEYEKYYGYTKKPELGADFIKENFGWFITQVSDIDYTIYQNEGQNNAGVYTIYFQNNGLHYKIWAPTKDIQTDFDTGNSKTLKALKGNQIQLQFNSIVENKANVEITEAQKAELFDSTKTISLSLLDIDCDQDYLGQCNFYFQGSDNQAYMLEVSSAIYEFAEADIFYIANNTEYLIDQYKGKTFESVKFDNIEYDYQIQSKLSNGTDVIEVDNWISRLYPGELIDFVLDLESPLTPVTEGQEGVSLEQEFSQIASINSKLVSIKLKNSKDLERVDNLGFEDYYCGIPGVVSYYNQSESNYSMHIIHKDFDASRDFNFTPLIQSAEQYIKQETDIDSIDGIHIASIFSPDCYPNHPDNYLYDLDLQLDKSDYSRVSVGSVQMDPENLQVNILAIKDNHLIMLSGNFAGSSQEDSNQLKSKARETAENLLEVFELE